MKTIPQNLQITEESCGAQSKIAAFVQSSRKQQGGNGRCVGLPFLVQVYRMSSFSVTPVGGHALESSHHPIYPMPIPHPLRVLDKLGWSSLMSSCNMLCVHSHYAFVPRGRLLRRAQCSLTVEHGKRALQLNPAFQNASPLSRSRPRMKNGLRN